MISNSGEKKVWIGVLYRAEYEGIDAIVRSVKYEVEGLSLN